MIETPGIERAASATQRVRLYRVEDVAHQLGIGRSLAYSLVSRGELKSIRVGKLLRVPTEALDEFIAQRLQSA